MKEDIDMHESAFEMHGVKYLSPSQINLFISSPAKWLVNVAGYKDKIYKPSFTYGNAVEIGITKSVTEGISIKESLDLANEEFSRIEQEAKQSKSEYDLEGATKKQAHLKTTLETVIPVYKDLGKPIAAQKKVEHYLELVGLSSHADAYPHQLSGGMQQRGSIVRALITNPKILLMDEPFGAVDAQTRIVLQEMLLRIWAKFGITIVFVTHDIDEAVLLADRIVIMGVNPGHIKEVVDIPLERPRSADSTFLDEFRHLKLQVLRSIREETSKLMLTV